MRHDPAKLENLVAANLRVCYIGQNLPMGSLSCRPRIRFPMVPLMKYFTLLPRNT